MKDYVIVTDATCDLPRQVVEELGITVLPMEFHMGQDTHVHQTGWGDMTDHDFFERLRKGETATTSQVSMQVYLDTFGEFLSQGKDVLYLAFSSGLSGSYNTALVAREELMDQYPERQLCIVDTLCAASGEGLLTWLAVQQQRDGASLQENVQWIEQHKLELCHWFTVDDLDHLKRGGRISGMTAALGTMLNVKPILRMDDTGHLVSVGKTRGRKKSIMDLVERTVSGIRDWNAAPVFVSHADSPEDAQTVMEKLRQAGAQQIILTDIGPIIGAHSGPGTLLISFWGKQR